jgi:hypothetical protein
MPDPDGNTEITAIESAYVDHLKGLFIALATKLINQPVTHATDRQIAGEFALAVTTAKRAKQLAVDAVGANQAITPGEAIAAARTMASAPSPQKPKPARSRKRK